MLVVLALERQARKHTGDEPPAVLKQHKTKNYIPLLQHIWYLHIYIHTESGDTIQPQYTERKCQQKWAANGEKESPELFTLLLQTWRSSGRRGELGELANLPTPQKYLIIPANVIVGHGKRAHMLTIPASGNPNSNLICATVDRLFIPVIV